MLLAAEEDGSGGQVTGGSRFGAVAGGWLGFGWGARAPGLISVHGAVGVCAAPAT